MNANTTALINQINENMKYYAMREFESDDIEQAFDETSSIPLAYTDLGDDAEFEIQVTLDLKNHCLTKEIKNVSESTKMNVFTEFTYFKDLKDIEEFTRYLTFDELIRTEINYEDLIDIL